MQTRGFMELTCPANGERSYGETYAGQWKRRGIPLKH